MPRLALLKISVANNKKNSALNILQGLNKDTYTGILQLPELIKKKSCVPEITLTVEKEKGDQTTNFAAMYLTINHINFK